MEKQKREEAERFTKKNSAEGGRELTGVESPAEQARPGPLPGWLQAPCIRPPALCSYSGFLRLPLHTLRSMGGRDHCSFDFVSLATAQYLGNICSRKAHSKSFCGHLSNRKMLMYKYLLSVDFA